MIGYCVTKLCSRVSFLMIVTFCFVFSFRCWAGSDTTEESVKPNKLSLTAGKSTVITSPMTDTDVADGIIRLTAGKSTVVTSPGPVKRVSVAVPVIADVMVMTLNRIYITGKAPGITNLMLWDVNDKLSNVFDLEVVPDVHLLKEKLHEMFPDEHEIQVFAANSRLTLKGAVSSTSTLSQILELAQTYAGGKNGVNNFLDVEGVQQVMLEVRVSEMSRTLTRRLGFNFNFVSSSGAQFGISRLGSLTTTTNPGFVTAYVDSISQIARFLGGGASWTVFIDALKEQDLLKILAEPTLITLSGKTAYFLAGGEFPVPIPQSLGLTTIQFKPFGVGLNFTPTVLSSGKINLQVAPEVSELDFANGVFLQGSTVAVPALTTRRVSTVVELADGQSFAIAGLLNDEIRETVQKTPVLGDMPVLGALLRSSTFKKNETELVVVVTIHLVKPLDVSKQTLPTDKYVEPNDYEFYLLGLCEGLSYNKNGGLEGDFGHINP